MHRPTESELSNPLPAASSAGPARAAQTPPALVVCLCADWCGVCRDYRATFEQLAREFADLRFVWLDIEDQADLVDALAVENFPTLLLAAAGQPVFFGPITPHPQTLRRLLQSHLQSPLPQAAPSPLADAPALAELVAKLAGA